MPQTRDLIASDQFSPSEVELTEIPFHPQERYQCGPAALATLLQANSLDVSPEELVSKVYIPKRKGSLQLEMIAATRDYGLVPYVIDGSLDHLFAEVAAGNPVLVLQNLGFDWMPRWHYAVVVGYNIDKEEIILRSGTVERLVTDMSTFERTWARSNYWAFVAVPADKLPITAEELLYLKTISGLEKVGKSDVAIMAYQTATRNWPESLSAQLALSNLYFNSGKIQQAESILRDAVSKHDDSVVAHNNLAYVLFRLNKLEEAYVVAKKASGMKSEFSQVALETLNQIREKIGK